MNLLILIIIIVIGVILYIYYNYFNYTIKDIGSTSKVNTTDNLNKILMRIYKFPLTKIVQFTTK